MAHLVKCSKCGVQFDRDIVPYKQINNRRYAHVNCPTEEELALIEKQNADKIRETNDRKELEEYISNIYGKEWVGTRIAAQISKYHNENNMTYRGMLNTLKYFYEIKHNPIDLKSDTIGILPYVYDEARIYYTAILEANNRNKNKPIAQIIDKEPIILTIDKPMKKSRIKKNLFEEW